MHKIKKKYFNTEFASIWIFRNDNFELELELGLKLLRCCCCRRICHCHMPHTPVTCASESRRCHWGKDRAVDAICYHYKDEHIAVVVVVVAAAVGDVAADGVVVGAAVALTVGVATLQIHCRPQLATSSAAVADCPLAMEDLLLLQRLPLPRMVAYVVDCTVAIHAVAAVAVVADRSNPWQLLPPLLLLQLLPVCPAVAGSSCCNYCTWALLIATSLALRQSDAWRCLLRCRYYYYCCYWSYYWSYWQPKVTAPIELLSIELAPHQLA